MTTQKPILRKKQAPSEAQPKPLFIPSVEFAKMLICQNTWGISPEKQDAIAQYSFDNQYAILEAIAKYHGREYDPKKSKNACAQYWL